MHLRLFRSLGGRATDLGVLSEFPSALGSLPGRIDAVSESQWRFGERMGKPKQHWKRGFAAELWPFTSINGKVLKLPGDGKVGKDVGFDS